MKYSHIFSRALNILLNIFSRNISADMQHWHFVFMMYSAMCIQKHRVMYIIRLCELNS